MDPGSSFETPSPFILRVTPDVIRGNVAKDEGAGLLRMKGRDDR